MAAISRVVRSARDSANVFWRAMLPANTEMARNATSRSRSVGAADAKTEVGRKGEKIQASGGNQRAENRGAKTEETSGEKHRRQQQHKEMAVEDRGKSPEAERHPHRERGSDVLRRRLNNDGARSNSSDWLPVQTFLSDCQLSAFRRGGRVASDAWET